MAADFAGVLHVYVHSISGFSDTACFMDKTDPFVELTLGEETYKTSTKDNAGGTCLFKEKLSFNKQADENMLTVRVMDSDTLSNDTLGEREIDLDQQELEGEYDPDDPIEFDMVKDGKTVGKVHLEFEACV